MREKLLDLMKNEGLKPGQLADLLGVNPAGISHILAGRNKPGFDLLQKILRRFPQINPDWLMLDAKTMYRSGYSAGSTAGTVPSSPTGNAPHAGTNDGVPHTGELFDRQPAAAIAPEPGECPAAATRTEAHGTTAPTVFPQAYAKADNEIVRIVVFYADGTFEHYAPTMR